MANDLGALDLTKPDGTTEAIKTLDNYERETKDVLVGWAGIEHDLKGRHKYAIGNTASRPATTGVSPAVTGTIYINTQTGQIEYYDGTLWRSASFMAESINYIFNGSGELYDSVGSKFIGWTKTGAGSSATRNTTNVKVGSTAMNLVRVGTNCRLAQDIASIWNGATWWRSKLVVFGCWVRNSGAATAKIALNDGVGTTTSAAQSAGSTYEWMQIARVIDGAATVVEPRLLCEDANGTVQFDGARLSIGYVIPDFIPGLWSDKLVEKMFESGAGTVAAGTIVYLGAVHSSTVEIKFPVSTPFIAKAMYTWADAVPGAGSFDYTLRRNSADTNMTSTTAGQTSNYTNAAGQVLYEVGDYIDVKLDATSGAGTPARHKVIILCEMVPSGI